MAEAKTKPAELDEGSWLAGVIPERQQEARHMLAIFAAETGFRPHNWSGMAGFGRYDYRYDSGHCGTIFAVGFAPRKAEIVVYLPCNAALFADLLARLGKHRLGKSCLYIKRLDGVDETVLRQLIRAGLLELAKTQVIHPL